MKITLVLAALLAVTTQANAMASQATPVRILPTSHTATHGNFEAMLPSQKLVNGLSSLFGSEDFREIRAQVIYSADHSAQAKPDHVLVYLFSQKFHRVDFASVKLDSEMNLGEVTRDYHQVQADKDQQPGISAAAAKCPDESIQFIAACPNDNSLELNVTNQVAKAAQDKGLKTVVILKDQLTRTNYLNYMVCPNLIGNFYDGDANTGVLATNDGEIAASEFGSVLKAKFRYKVTNIWLACEAYNDPMLTAIRDTDQSQKYAAGINDLAVGPSDNAAACAMEAGIAGKPLTASFNDCVKKLDNSTDQWGFGGKGADYLGK